MDIGIYCLGNLRNIWFCMPWYPDQLQENAGYSYAIFSENKLAKNGSKFSCKYFFNYYCESKVKMLFSLCYLMNILQNPRDKHP
jgi:hypothetical protein